MENQEQQSAENQEQEEYPPEIVERAKTMGHIPKEEFKGDPEKWVPPDKYVERAETLMPILKSQLRKFEEKTGQYETEISGLKTSLETQKKTTEKLVKMSSTISQQAYEKAKRDLTMKQAQAVKDADVDKWQVLEDQKDKLEKPEPVTIEEASAPSKSPIFNNWHVSNDWYAKDSDLTIFADAYGRSVAEATPGLPEDQLLSRVEAKVKEAFPHKFTNPNRQAANTVDGGSERTTTTTTGKKSFNNLPADAKTQCDMFIADGTIKSREQYVKDYFEEA